MSRTNDIDNLIIAAAAASGEGLTEHELLEQHGEEPNDLQRPGFWRPVVLQPEHIHDIGVAAKRVCDSKEDRRFLTEPLNRRQISEVAYQEMMSLMDFKCDGDSPDRVQLMRKHSMIYSPTGPNSRALTLHEQAINEAAAQIAYRLPAVVFHKRELAILAKQAVRDTGVEFPNARSGYYPPGSIVPYKTFADSMQLEGTRNVLQPAHAAPASALILQQKSGALMGKRELSRMLSVEECSIIAQTVMEMEPEIPRCEMRTREQCSLVENYVYTDARRIEELPPESLDDEMDYIREISVVCGRYPSGPRNPTANLSVYELAVNEAAAWLVRMQPALLTHSRRLADLARRVITTSGLNFQSSGPQSFTPTQQTQYAGDQWSSRSHFGIQSSTSLGSSGDVQIRLQGDTYSSCTDVISSNIDMFGSGLIPTSGTVGDAGGASSYYIDSLGGSAGPTGGFSVMTTTFEDEIASSGLDSNELIHLLGGSHAIAQLSDSQLEELGRAQFTVVDSRADNELANCPLILTAEEDDRPLDESEILRVSRCSSLERVRVLSLPASGYTSINATHLARCIQLQQLDLSENALRVFPRRLHLPQLRRLSLNGNRFIHLPLVEQFPRLARLALDDKLRQMLNPQMLAFFCPNLRMINNQYFDEPRSDFTARIIQEARSVVEPHIRSKWESDYADMYQVLPRNRDELLHLMEQMVVHLKERNLLMDEALFNYKDLMLYQFVNEYFNSKLRGSKESERNKSVGAAVSENHSVMSHDAVTHIEMEIDHSAGELSDIDKDALEPVAVSVQSNHPVDLDRVGGELENGENDTDDYDLEEKEAEARSAGERALFEATDELLGLHLPDPSNTCLAGIGSTPGQLQTTLVMDGMGRLHQQQVIVAAGNQLVTTSQQSALFGHSASSGSVAPYQLHLGRSLRQGRSIVMTVVRPRGVSGRPVAEFLPGELRNKDYVKGYMASEIYKKAVKDTLGQKSTPKKRPASGRPKKAELTSSEKAWTSGSPASVNMTPLSEVNADVRGGSSKKSMLMGPRGKHQGKSTEYEQHSGDPAMARVGSSSLPPRPKKRKPMGMHRSLRDLCSDTSDTGAFTGGTASTGPRSDATAIDYDPLHFIRCHAKDNDAGDSETKVWRCLFEPNPMRPDETTHVVATCGGECVCLINCETGKVMKRFKHMEEEFYTIAWTTVEVESGKNTNILAAAGRMREIRLLHPEQLVCYAEMKGHTEDVTAMIFHQTQSTILFSGDSKASVIVWDIGIPSVPDYKTRYQLLMRLRCPRLDVNPVLNLVFLPHYAYLIAGCEDGLFAWKVTDMRLEKREREPDMELKLDVEHEVCIDGLAQLSDNALVLKVVESGEIMVFDFASVLERRKGLQRIVPIEMRGHLLWQRTDEIYINVSVRQNLGAVLCGDNEGSIWIYDLDLYLDDLHASSRKKFQVKPIKILEWPECSVQGNRDEDQQLKESITSGFRNPVVNSVEMSSDGYFLAAVTDNNLVCIWRYAPPQQLTPTQHFPQLVRSSATLEACSTQPASSTATHLVTSTASASMYEQNFEPILATASGVADIVRSQTESDVPTLLS